MDVAITGSSGLIGTAFINALQKRGDRAIRIVRRKPDDNEIRWDIVAGTIDADGLEGVDAVVHLSGESLGNKKWSAEQKAEIERSRIDSTALLSRTLAGLEKKPSVLLTQSAAGFYGDRGIEELTESSSIGSTYLAGVVERWEAATQPAEDAGIRVCHMRSGIVLSPLGGAVKETLLPFKVGLGGTIGGGKQYWPWISIHDQVGAMMHMIDHPELSGPVNITAPTPATNATYTRAFGGALGRPTVLPTPKIVLDLKLGREATREMLMASTKVIPRKLIDSNYIFRHETVEEAFIELFG